MCYTDRFYPTSTLKLAFISTDIAILIFGLPFIIVSVWMAMKKKVIGLLCWPGSLFFILYTYIPYLIALPFNKLFLPYLLIITTSAYTILYLLAGINRGYIFQRIQGRMPYRLSGGILLVLAILIFVRQMAFVFAAHIKLSQPGMLEISIWISDLSLVFPALIYTGFSLLQNKPTGYIAGAGMLLSYGQIVLSHILVLIIQSKISDFQYGITDLIPLVLMVAICVWPLSFYFGAVIKSKKS